ncbi:MAG: histidine phosphatase family protein [Burkholderiales bacterium]|nr:histidine phosphatase family protein [Burkholderiales bacterium]
MELILWRHAEAFDGTPDLSRRLTPKGRRQAETVAAWLEPRLPRRTRVIASPAVRTQETAQALTSGFDTVATIAPGASAAAVLAAADWPHGEHAVLVVGHQPTLGEVAGLLMGVEAAQWTVKKGAVWWFAHRVRGEDAQVVLRAVVAPDLV